MKKTVAFLVLSMSMALSYYAYGAESIKLNIDNNEIASDVAPQIIDGRTLVPVRAIFEGIGASVEWDSETKTIKGAKDGVEVVMSIDSNIAKVNSASVTMDCEPVIIEGRTYAPARYVAEAFGCKVSWDNNSKTVNIATPAKNEAATEKISETTTEAATETTTLETTTNPMYNYDTYYKAGTYEAGKDIPFGEYVIFANPNAVGAVNKYNKDGNVNSRNGKRSLYSKSFDYCDIIKLEQGNFADITSAYAVPLADAVVDNSHNGTYKAGTSIKSGHLTFKLSPESKVAYVDVGQPDAVTKDRTIQYLTEDNDSVVINVTAGMYVRVFGCDVYNESLAKISEYKPVSENGNHTDAKLNMADVTPSVKKQVDDYLTTLVSEMTPKSLKSTKYTDAYFKKISSDWSSLAKTSADRKYIEIAKKIYGNIRAYAAGTKIDAAYAVTVRVNGKDMSGSFYREILQAEKDYINDIVSDFKNSATFEDAEVSNTNLTNYRVDVPRLTGTKVN